MLLKHLLLANEQAKLRYQMINYTSGSQHHD